MLESYVYFIGYQCAVAEDIKMKTEFDDANILCYIHTFCSGNK